MAPSVTRLSLKDLDRSSSFPLFLMRRKRTFDCRSAGKRAVASACSVVAERTVVGSTVRRKELELTVRSAARWAERVACDTLGGVFGFYKDNYVYFYDVY